MNADTILTNPNTIELLIKRKKLIIAPLLKSPQSMYSTFQTKNPKIFEAYYGQNKKACMPVHNVQECYLMKLDPQIVETVLKDGTTLIGVDDDGQINQKLQGSSNFIL